MDTIKVEITEDGQVKIITEEVSTGNHRNADELLKAVALMMGGDVNRTENRGRTGHGHTEQQIRRHH